MKKIIVTILSLFLFCSAAQAEQKVIYGFGKIKSEKDGFSTINKVEPPDMTQVNALIKEGWRINSITTSPNTDNNRLFIVIFLMEK